MNEFAPERLRRTSPSNGCGSCSPQVPPHTAHAFFTPQALWHCTHLKTGMEFEVSGTLAQHYLGTGDPVSDGIRTLLEKGLTDYFIKDGLHVKLKTKT